MPTLGCSPPPNSAPLNTELVLKEGSRLEVTSPNGNIAIVAGKGLARQYQWNGCSLDANMGARRSRWFGSLGIYDPAGRLGQEDFKRYASCKGVSRTVVEEGQMHFSDVESAEEWIHHHASTSWKTVWTNDGLVFSWIISSAYAGDIAIGGLSADLKLVCINGRRPTKLTSANDEAIKVTHKDDANQAVHECAKVGSDVIAETQRVLIEDWKRYGGYVERTNKK